MGTTKLHCLKLHFKRISKHRMRTSLVSLGKGFGQLGVTIRGTTKYHLSPFEQKAFAGFFTTGVPNTLWRMRKSLPNLIPFAIAYLIFDSVEKEHDRLIRKQPGEFDHEE